jgi:uncharacterized protein YnzC (UPF0291/DUF896 family)
MTLQDSVDQQMVIKKAYIQIQKIRNKIQDGDLVTRTGNDFTSESLRSLNQRNKTYSHCGIASIENDSVFVYHALGGEWNRDQKILRQPLEDFAEPYSNRGIGIYRFRLTHDTYKALMDTVKQYYHRGIMFDMDFDLATDNQMYCAEFVAKSFINGTSRKLAFSHSFIGRFEFIGIDDIFLHPFSKSIEQLVYK